MTTAMVQQFKTMAFRLDGNMNDVTGKALAIGDKIVLIPQDGYTQSLSMGIVIGFTPKKVTELFELRSLEFILLEQANIIQPKYC